MRVTIVQCTAAERLIIIIVGDGVFCSTPLDFDACKVGRWEILEEVYLLPRQISLMALKECTFRTRQRVTHSYTHASKKHTANIQSLLWPQGRPDPHNSALLDLIRTNIICLSDIMKIL